MLIEFEKVSYSNGKTMHIESEQSLNDKFSYSANVPSSLLFPSDTNMNQNDNVKQKSLDQDMLIESASQMDWCMPSSAFQDKSSKNLSMFSFENYGNYPIAIQTPDSVDNSHHDKISNQMMMQEVLSFPYN